MKIRKMYPFVLYPVNVRGKQEGMTVAGHVSVSLVIGHDDDYIGLFSKGVVAGCKYNSRYHNNREQK